ncbi:MAG: hypothetical protein J6U97_06785, partial [Bacteroidaceae bacterium]|nr:hypothetical protein [Bacteroidaceae bacterium]
QGNAVNSINVIGGTFNDNINEQFWAHEVDIEDANGNLGVIVDNGDGTWTVSYCDPIGGSYKEDIEPAEGSIAYLNSCPDIVYDALWLPFVHARAGDMITILKDIEQYSNYSSIDETSFGFGTLTVDLNGCKINSTGSVLPSNMLQGQRLVIKDFVGNSEIICTGSEPILATWGSWNCSGELVVGGGSYIGGETNIVIRECGGKIRIYDGSFVSTGALIENNYDTNIGPAVMATSNNGEIEVFGGNFTGRIILNNGYGRIIIRGGCFNLFEVVDKNDWADDSIVIYGGTFDSDPSAYVANGYVATQNSDGMWVVAEGSGEIPEDTEPDFINGVREQYSWNVPKVNPENPVINFDGVVDLEGEWKGAQCVSIDMSEDSTTYQEITVWPQGVWSGDFKVGSYEHLDPKWRMTIDTYFLWDEAGLYIATKCDDSKVFKGLYSADEYMNYLSGRADYYDGNLGNHLELMITCINSSDAYINDLGGHWPNFFMGTTNAGEACWQADDTATDSADPNPNEITQKFKHGQMATTIPDADGNYSFSQEIFIPWEYINQDIDSDGKTVTVGNVGTAGTTYTAGLIYSVRS